MTLRPLYCLQPQGANCRRVQSHLPLLSEGTSFQCRHRISFACRVTQRWPGAVPRSPAGSSPAAPEVAKVKIHAKTLCNGARYAAGTGTVGGQPPCREARPAAARPWPEVAKVKIRAKTLWNEARYAAGTGTASGQPPCHEARPTAARPRQRWRKWKSVQTPYATGDGMLGGGSRPRRGRCCAGARPSGRSRAPRWRRWPRGRRRSPGRGRSSGC